MQDPGRSWKTRCWYNEMIAVDTGNHRNACTGVTVGEYLYLTGVSFEIGCVVIKAPEPKISNPKPPSRSGI